MANATAIVNKPEVKWAMGITIYNQIDNLLVVNLHILTLT